MKKAMLVVLVLGLAMPALADVKMAEMQTNIYGPQMSSLRGVGSEIYSSLTPVGGYYQGDFWVFDDLQLLEFGGSSATDTTLDTMFISLYNVSMSDAGDTNGPLNNPLLEIAFYAFDGANGPATATTPLVASFQYQTTAADDVTLDPGWYTGLEIDISGQNIDLAGHDAVWAGFRYVSWDTTVPDGQYANPGQIISGGNQTAGASADVFFKGEEGDLANGSLLNFTSGTKADFVWELTTITPEPATCVLLALGGFALIRRR